MTLRRSTALLVVLILTAATRLYAAPSFGDITRVAETLRAHTKNIQTVMLDADRVALDVEIRLLEPKVTTKIEKDRLGKFRTVAEKLKLLSAVWQLQYSLNRGLDGGPDHAYVETLKACQADVLALIVAIDEATEEPLPLTKGKR